MDQREGEISLEEADIRRVVRLLTNALAPEVGRGPKVERLMAGLGEWIGFDGWIWARSRVDPASGRPENYDFLYGGTLDQHQFAVWADRSLEAQGTVPENDALRERLYRDQKHFTVARDELVPKQVWGEPAQREFIRSFGYDQTLYSLNPLTLLNGGVMVSYIVMFRKNREPDFSSRDAALAQLILSEVGPLHADALNVGVADDVAALTPRQRTVLAALIDGMSVKQAAASLRLSPHTINDHCKTIYKHFKVRSRGELVRRFMSRANTT